MYKYNIDQPGIKRKINENSRYYFKKNDKKSK